MTKSKARPKWTVHYNIASDGSPWVGTGWEFFDNKRLAEDRHLELSLAYDGLIKQYASIMRPFHEEVDFPHLGAVHRM